MHRKGVVVHVCQAQGALFELRKELRVPAPLLACCMQFTYEMKEVKILMEG